MGCAQPSQDRNPSLVVTASEAPRVSARVLGFVSSYSQGLLGWASLASKEPGDLRSSRQGLVLCHTDSGPGEVSHKCSQNKQVAEGREAAEQ